ncbi:MAG: tryptophan-rich sensory protein [Congregibacter sp.]|nr:tryptophan-rich sensory protein [Congregibacter sp.]MDP5072034.1 tryptophan-rich sensory protein [Congregibacter sp.]
MNRPHQLTFMQQSTGLAAWLFFVFLAAGIGGYASSQAPTFYKALERPEWAPPAWLFGPAWGVLYTLMGISAWLVWRQKGFAGARLAFVLFFAQIAVNALWTWLFFVWQLGAIATAEILVLWLLIAATGLVFYRDHKTAAVLLAPYLAWVSFAGALSYTLWQMNPQTLG